MSDATPRPDVLTRTRELSAAGISLNEIARKLQAEQYPTQRGGRWYPQQVKNLLNSPRPSSAFLVPCAVCGRLTASKYGICHTGVRGACRRAYANTSRETLNPRVPTQPCANCGRPTRSDLGVCGRPSCRNERMRVFRAGLELGSSVYAVWFPSPSILKIGFSAATVDSIFTGAARVRAKRRNWDTKGSRCIWKQPGDTRTEAWMQATLAFRWRPAYNETSGRICEWFAVHHLYVEEIARALDGVYRLVPPDLT